jgi:hypothetical protein
MDDKCGGEYQMRKSVKAKKVFGLIVILAIIVSVFGGAVSAEDLPEGLRKGVVNDEEIQTAVGNLSAQACGDMGVNPASWSPTINFDESDKEIVTVSASSGIVNGVTVSKISGPNWLSVSSTNLGDIASGSNKTFTMIASPPFLGTCGDFGYSVRVSNTCGSPSTTDVSGTIHLDCSAPNQPPSYSNFSVSPISGTLSRVISQ